MITNKDTIASILFLSVCIAGILLTHHAHTFTSGAYSPTQPLPTTLPATQASIATLAVEPAKTPGKVIVNPKSFTTGMASYYTIASSSHKTASGQEYLEDRLTVAHKTLPFGTRVKITNLDKSLSVIAIVNDRGPYIAGRIVDLSPAANKVIDCNLCRVNMEVL